MNYFHAVVDEAGHDAAAHPCAAERTDEKQDEDRGHHGGDTADESALKLMPSDFVDSDTDGGGDGSGDKQGQLARSGEGVYAESENRKEKYGDQRDDRYERKPYGWQRRGRLRIAVAVLGLVYEVLFDVAFHCAVVAFCGLISINQIFYRTFLRL